MKLAKHKYDAEKNAGTPASNLGGYWRSLKKKEDFKGFTLVELNVVIVILAILAAILIPGLLKFYNGHIREETDNRMERKRRCYGSGL